MKCFECIVQLGSASRLAPHEAVTAFRGTPLCATHSMEAKRDEVREHYLPPKVEPKKAK